MYSSFFYLTFHEKGFEGVRNYYRRSNVLSFKIIFIPIHKSNHWFLIMFNGKELISYDPYNYPGAEGQRKEQLLKENTVYHEKILQDLKDNYFKPLFKMHNKKLPNISLRVQIPPNVPEQNNSYDCGVFLLTFAKYLLFNRKFDLTNDDMIDIPNEI